MPITSQSQWLKTDLQNIVFQLYLTKTDPCSSCTVSFCDS